MTAWIDEPAVMTAADYRDIATFLHREAEAERFAGHIHIAHAMVMTAVALEAKAARR